MHPCEIYIFLHLSGDYRLTGNDLVAKSGPKHLLTVLTVHSDSGWWWVCEIR